MKRRIVTHSAKDTTVLGRKISRLLKAGDVIILAGALGGGKTTFMRGIVSGFGCKAQVHSPSFTLLRHYVKKKIHLCHADLYRITAADTMNLGLDDYLYDSGTITVIEWGEKIQRYLPRYIKIRFSFLGENSRAIVFSLKGYPPGRFTA